MSTTIKRSGRPRTVTPTAIAVFASATEMRKELRKGLKGFLRKYSSATDAELPAGWTERQGQFSAAVRITASDVQNGKAAKSNACPLARAAKRTPIGRLADDVHVTRTDTKFVFRKSKTILRVRNDHRLRDAISVFDAEKIWAHRYTTYMFNPLPARPTPKRAAKAHVQKVVALTRKSTRTNPRGANHVNRPCGNTRAIVREMLTT